jgi:outer membrane protein TolC
MNVPLWTSGQTSSILQQAKIDLQNAQLQLQMVDKAMVLELNNAVAEYNEYIDTLAANQAAVKLAQDSFKMMQDLLASGQVSLTDLNDSELLLTSGKLKLQVTLFNLNATIAKIEKMAGKLIWQN